MRLLQLLRAVGRRLRSDQIGMTITEVLVGSVLIAMGIGGAITVFTHSAEGEVVAEKNQVGVTQAEQAIEEMRALDYADLKLTAAPNASTGADDPNDRVASGQLDLGGGRTEDLILPTDPSAGTPLVAPYGTHTYGTGASATTVRVYRFVTWRDEECPTVSLTNLDSTLSDLATTLTATRSKLDALTGSSGTLNTLSGHITSASGLNVTALLLNQLMAILNPAKAIADNLNSNLTGLSGELGTLQTAVTALQNRTELDLCDISPELIANLKKLKTLRTTLLAISTALTGVQNATAQIDGVVTNLLGSSLLTLPGKVTAALTSLPPYITNLTNARNDLNTALSDLSGGAADVSYLISYVGDAVDTVDQILATQSTTRNTKRLTVAIVVETPDGPRKPVWASTVVTDPDAGLAG